MSTKRPAMYNFLRGILTQDYCWLWKHPNKITGYGEFIEEKIHVSAHRFSYESFVGEIPSGLQIDHLCRNRACVNPLHMRIATIKENVLAGVGITAINNRKDQCLRGHDLKDGNLFHFKNKRGKQMRGCILCRRLNDIKRRGWAKLQAGKRLNANEALFFPQFAGLKKENYSLIPLNDSVIANANLIQEGMRLIDGKKPKAEE